MALARLQQSKVTRPPGPRPVTGGTPQPRLAPVQSWPSPPPPSPPPPPERTAAKAVQTPDPTQAGFLSFGFAEWECRLRVPVVGAWDEVMAVPGRRPSVRRFAGVLHVAGWSGARLVQLAPSECAGDIWTILSVRSSPFHLPATTLLPHVALEVETPDWEGVDRELNQGPPRAGTVSMVGVRVRVREPWPRSPEALDIDLPIDPANPFLGAVLAAALAPSAVGGLVSGGLVGTAIDGRSLPAPFSLGSLCPTGTVINPRAQLRPRPATAHAALGTAARPGRELARPAPLPMPCQDTVAAPLRGVGASPPDPAASLPPEIPLRTSLLALVKSIRQVGPRSVHFVNTRPTQPEGAPPLRTSARAMLDPVMRLALEMCGAVALSPSTPTVGDETSPRRPEIESLALVVAVRKANPAIAALLGGGPRGGRRARLSQSNFAAASQPWLEPIPCGFGGRDGAR